MQYNKIENNIPHGQNVYTLLKSLRYDIPHTHEFIEIFYVLSGSCYHRIGGATVKIHTGDTYMLFPGEIHNHIKEGMSENFMYRDILIMPSYFKQLCLSYYDTLYDQFNENSIQKKISLNNTELFLFENLFIKHFNTPSDKKDNINNLILHNFITAFIDQSVLQITNPYPNWLITLISELDRSLNFKKPLQNIISCFHYSKPYICNTFKKYIGTTITDYFNKNRISYANNLLNSTNYTIDQICEMSGFNNLSYFYSLYKKHYGKTPRNSHKHN